MFCNDLSASFAPPMFAIIQKTALCHFIFRIIDLIIQVKKDESFLLPSNLWYAVAEIWPHPFYLFEFEQNVRNTEFFGISWISSLEKKRREVFHLIIQSIFYENAFKTGCRY